MKEVMGLALIGSPQVAVAFSAVRSRRRRLQADGGHEQR
jgi:hypothetical protein